MPRRVVLDTNVIVAALRSRRGASAAVLMAGGEEQIEFCLSVALLTPRQFLNELQREDI